MDLVIEPPGEAAPGLKLGGGFSSPGGGFFWLFTPGADAPSLETGGGSWSRGGAD